MKKYKIKVDKQEIMNIPHGIILGYNREDKQVNLSIIGKLSLDELLDIFNTATYELLETFYKRACEKAKHKAQIRREIYNRAVMGFSLMIDKFDPEAKNTRFAKLTDEAILKAQNDILLKNKKVQ